MSEVKSIRAATTTATGKCIDNNLFLVTDPKRKDKYTAQDWDIRDRSRCVPLVTMDTMAVPAGMFSAVPLRAGEGQAPGQFRWILWRVAPVTELEKTPPFRSGRGRGVVLCLGKELW